MDGKVLLKVCIRGCSIQKTDRELKWATVLCSEPQKSQDSTLNIPHPHLLALFEKKVYFHFMYMGLLPARVHLCIM